MKHDPDDWYRVQQDLEERNIGFGYRWWQRIKMSSVLVILALIAAAYFWK